jgi:cytochrome c oxidase cbb3-type subunit III
LSKSVLLGAAVTIVFMLTATSVKSWAAGNEEAAQEYLIYCSKCHGATGHGDGPNASTLKTRPRDFADCATMSKISSETLFKAIKEGGAAVNLPNDMPPWGQAFDDAEIKGLIQYVRTFCKK